MALWRVVFVKTPTQSPEEWSFLSLAFFNAPSFFQEWFQQTKPKKVRFTNFPLRSLDLVPEPAFASKCFTKSLKKGVPELVPDSCLESSQTSLYSVWFPGTTPDFHTVVLIH